MQKPSLCVHAGKSDESIGVVNAIEPSSAFLYVDEGPQLYPRYFNTPNQRIVASQVQELEGAEAGLVFGSGMTAISTTLLSLLKSGDHIVLQRALYGGTHALVVKELESLGIETSFVDCDAGSLLEAVRSNTRVIYVETPANPLLEVIDLAAVAEGAQSKSITTIVDNTFASPINQNPIALGFDVVIHSGTKYLGGHSDLSFGAVATSQELADRIWNKAILLGGTVNAMTCYLIERSIKTLHLRVSQQNTNAQLIAEHLSSHDRVEQVHYPGLSSHPGHSIAVKQMTGFGGMLSFSLEEGCCVKRFLQSLALISPAMSLGGIESTTTIPALTSHKPMPAEERLALGISDNLIRLSVGIESAADLMDDLDQAIERSRLSA